MRSRNYVAEGYRDIEQHSRLLPFCCYVESCASLEATTSNTDPGIYDLVHAINKTGVAVCRIACEGHLGRYALALPHVFFHNIEQDGCGCGSPFHGFMGWLFTQRSSLNLSLEWRGYVFSRPDGGRWAVLKPEGGLWDEPMLWFPVVRKYWWAKVFRPKLDRDIALLTKAIQDYTPSVSDIH